MLRISGCLLLFAGAGFAQTPSISNVVNAASFAAGTLAPGSAATVFGSNLASATALPAAYPLPTFLGNATVYVSGIASPLTYVSFGQINFQVPWEIGTGPVSIVLIANGSTSNQMSIQISSAAPGIFAGWVFFSAYGPAADATMHSGEYLTILATGLGPVDSPPATGMPIAVRRLRNCYRR